jgi:ABC-2 type transport system ATP-binding protein
MSAIAVAGLVKRYGSFTAVNDVSFEVSSGQVTALLGPNGAGKTTTIEIMEGFLAPTAGTVRVLGADPRKRSRAWRARIGLVLQATSLDNQLTVTEALSLFGALYPAPRRVSEVLELIDMTDDARTRIGALSGGQKRRVDLGIAIIGQPELLFLDEPTTGLDPEARRRLWSIIENLVADGATVLLTTHYMDEAQQLASRVIVLADGQVVADATPDGLRAMGGVPVISYRLPATAPRLPAELAGYLDPTQNRLTLPSTDVTEDLSLLVGWARTNNVDLTGLEVGPPSLEDAYLALTAEREGVPCHG